MSYGRSIKIAARSSPLSMAQAKEVLALLSSIHCDETFEITPLASEGDIKKKVSLNTLERGVFAKRIEQALIDGEADIAVHSAKDVPSDIPDGLTIAGYTRRMDPRDVIVQREECTLDDLPTGFRLGTSSQRRSCQILNLRPDIDIVPIRGNVDSRITLIEKGTVDGVVLGAAGLMRLGRLNEISSFLSLRQSIPDVGQGALLIQCRNDDILPIVSSCLDDKTQMEITAERAFVSAIGGSCTSPVAAYAETFGSQITIRVMAGLANGTKIYTSEITQSLGNLYEVGENAAVALSESGASGLIGDIDG